jgi:hypothetical protein
MMKTTLRFFLFLFFTGCDFAFNEILNNESPPTQIGCTLIGSSDMFKQLPSDFISATPNSSKTASSNIKDVKIKNGQLYVLTNKGLSTSSDNGLTWTNRGRYNEGLTQDGNLISDFYSPTQVIQKNHLSFDSSDRLVLYNNITNEPNEMLLTSSNNGCSFSYVTKNISSISIPESIKSQIENLLALNSITPQYDDDLSQIPIGKSKGQYSVSQFFVQKSGNTIIALYSMEIINDFDLGQVTFLLKSSNNGSSYSVTELGRTIGVAQSGLPVFAGMNLETFFTSDLRIVARDTDVLNKVYISDTNQQNFQEFTSMNLTAENHHTMLLHNDKLIYFNSGSLYQLDIQTMSETTLFTDPALSNISLNRLYAHNDSIYIAHSQGLFKLEASILTEVISANIYPSNIQVAATDGDTIYLGTKSGFYISQDLGQTLFERNTNHGLGSNAVSSVLVTSDNIYVGTSNGISISSDGGNSFTNYITGATNNEKDILSILVKDNTLFVGTRAGLFVTPTDVIIFTKLDFATNGLPQAAAISAIIEHDNNIYVTVAGATSDTNRRGLYLSNNNGVNFSRDPSIDEALFSIHIDQDDTFYLGRVNGLAFKAPQDNDWNLVAGNIVVPETNSFKPKSYYVHTNGDVLISGYNGLAISKDNGASFQSIFTKPGTALGWDMSSLFVLGDYLIVTFDGELYIAKDFFQ